MKTSKTILVSLFLCLGYYGNSQVNLSSIIELNVDFGLSNDLTTKDFYRTNNATGDIIINNKRFTKTRNISLGYTFLFNSNNGIKASFGYAKYGFYYQGILVTSQSSINDTYRKTFSEWGISYVHKIPVFSIAKLIIEPGLRYHTNGNPASRGLVFSDKDSYSISSYTGLEIPMSDNNFFVTAGLQLKFPILRYDYEFQANISKGYYPYFIGLKIGINFQF